MNPQERQAADLRALSMAQMQQQQGQVSQSYVNECTLGVLQQTAMNEQMEAQKQVALVKPEKAKAAENYLLQVRGRIQNCGHVSTQLIRGGAAQRGQIDEETVRGVLEKMSEASGKGSGFRRKKFGSDDEDDDF
ncbi:programmed cell death protein 5-like [Condylostylus longicornis]|uniref:programmed cell death protein 5-like n=1 Tax=Condylostylus longicornis TaxID=2530218 RepID=UPI00244DDB47|nr:programmed cell death protein 5-like [Condylostylus longicornis]